MFNRISKRFGQFFEEFGIVYNEYAYTHFNRYCFKKMVMILNDPCNHFFTRQDPQSRQNRKALVQSLKTIPKHNVQMSLFSFKIAGLGQI